MVVVAGVDESRVWILPWLENDTGEVLQLVPGVFGDWLSHDEHAPNSRTNNCFDVSKKTVRTEVLREIGCDWNRAMLV